MGASYPAAHRITKNKLFQSSPWFSQSATHVPVVAAVALQLTLDEYIRACLFLQVSQGFRWLQLLQHWRELCMLLVGLWLPSCHCPLALVPQPPCLSIFVLAPFLCLGLLLT